MKELDPYSQLQKINEEQRKPRPDKFSAMDEAVDKMCKSLEEEPHKWFFDTCHFHKRGTNVQYWDANGIDAFADIWNGYSCHQVFSKEQKLRIKASYDIARVHQSSALQRKVIDQFSDSSVEETKSKKSTGIFGLLKSIFWDVK